MPRLTFSRMLNLGYQRPETKESENKGRDGDGIGTIRERKLHRGDRSTGRKKNGSASMGVVLPLNTLERLQQIDLCITHFPWLTR